MRLARPVRVLVAAAGESPAVIGWLRPAILLPAATLLNLTPDQLEAVLAHELAHIRRQDYLVNLLQVVAETLLFYHPAVWWVSARMRHERELCCDDLAVRSCGDALCYARALTRLERLRLTAPAMAMGSNGGSMLYRIQRLMGAGGQEYAPSKLPGIAALALGVICLSLTMHHARGQEKPTQSIAVAFTARAEEAPQDSPGITVDLQGASLMHRTGIEYPGSALERNVEGTVLAEVTLDASGAVTDARILAGPVELRKSVLQSVLQWHFTPNGAGATRNVNIAFQRVPGESRPVEYKTKQFVFTAPRTNNSDDVVREQKLKAEIAAQEKVILDTQNGMVTLEPPVAEKQAAELRQLREQLVRSEGPQIAGSKLVRIDMPGLSEQQQADLQGRLPVQLGDTLTPASIEMLTKTVREYDAHLEVNLYHADGGVGARILVRGTGGRFRM
jgi:TonB family protein